MDCKHARELLELTSREIPDHADPEFQAAIDHLQDCESCAEVLAARSEQDLILGKIFRNVPVPEGLEERLLQALDRELLASANPASLPQGQNPTAANRRRRLSRRSSLVAAVAVCLVVGLWFWNRSPAVSLDTLTAQAVQSIESGQFGPRFDGSFDPEAHYPEDSLRMPPHLERHAFRQLPGVPQHCEAAISKFSFIDRRGRSIQGALIIIPVGNVAEPPSATGMVAAPTEYRDHGFHAKSWQNGGFVYLCLVNGGEETLLKLQRSTGPDFS